MPHFPNLLSLPLDGGEVRETAVRVRAVQMRHIARLFGELRRRGSDTFEVTDAANTEFLDEMTDHLQSSVFYHGNCASSRSYYFNQHGEATLLRPTSTLRTLREMEHFPLDAYAYR